MPFYLVMLMIMLMGYTHCFSQEPDTVFHVNGQIYVGRIGAYIPDDGVSILTEDKKAFFIPWKNLARVVRHPREPITSGRLIGPSQRIRLDTANLPLVMVSATVYLNVFLGTIESSMLNGRTADHSWAVAGWGRGLNATAAAYVGPTVYLGMALDYTSASYQDGIGSGPAKDKGLADFFSIGPSISADLSGVWYSGSVSYLYHRYEWDSGPVDSYNGWRVQCTGTFPVSRILAVTTGIRADVVTSMHANFLLGITFSNIMEALYDNLQ